MLKNPKQLLRRDLLQGSHSTLLRGGFCEGGASRPQGISKRWFHDLEYLEYVEYVEYLEYLEYQRKFS